MYIHTNYFASATTPVVVVDLLERRICAHAYRSIKEVTICIICCSKENFFLCVFALTLKSVKTRLRKARRYISSCKPVHDRTHISSKSHLYNVNCMIRCTKTNAAKINA